MKAILLAGGKGTRLRPLTLHTPKPIVPIFDRPFLQYQIDLLRQVPEIDEIVLSLNYQPRRIEEVFGDGSRPRRPPPLRRRAARRSARAARIKFAAGEHRGEPIVVFNGDVFTSVDLPAVIALHRERQAKATIVLTPVDNPSAYGLVETDADGNILAFLEKPSPDQIRCDTINAGIYVLEPDTLERDSARHGVLDRARLLSVAHRRTARRSSPTSTAATGSTSARRRSTARRTATSWTAASSRRRSPARPGSAVVSPDARIEEGATIEGPCFIDAGVVDQARRAHRALQRHRPALPHRRGRRRRRRDPLAEHLGRHRGADRRRASPAGTATSAATSRSATRMFGDKSVVTDYSRA